MLADRSCSSACANRESSANVRSDGDISANDLQMIKEPDPGPADEILFFRQLLGGDLRWLFRIVVAEAELLVRVARKRFDRGQHIDIAPGRLDVELAELARSDQRPSLKAGHEAVVIVHCGRKAA